MKHSILAPSSAYRWLICPASLVACSGIEEADSVYATTGTLAHEVGSLLLEAALKDAKTLQSEIFRIKKAQNNISSEMLENVLTYVTTATTMTGDPVKAGVEAEVDLTEVYDCGTTEQGTTDFFGITSKGELQIHDLKYGRYPISAENNKQLLIYALGVFYEYGDLYEVNNIRVVVHQPLLRTVSEHTLTVPQLKSFGEEVKNGARVANNLLKLPTTITLSDYTPSDATCKFCPAKGMCAALERHVKSLLIKDFAETPVTDAVKQLTEQTKRFYTADADLGERYNNVALIRAWCTAVETCAYNTLKNGGIVTGWKLILGRKKAGVWVDEEETIGYILSKRLSCFLLPKTLISPAKAKKALKNKPKSWENLVSKIHYGEAAPKMVEAGAKGVPYEAQQVTLNEFDKEDIPDDLAEKRPNTIDSSHKNVKPDYSELFTKDEV